MHVVFVAVVDLSGRLSVQEQALKELQNAPNEILMEIRFVHEEGFSFRIITQWSQTEQPNKQDASVLADCIRQ